MNKSKEEWRLKLASLLQDGDISVKHPRIEKKIWDCVQDAIESEAVKRENFAFNKGRTTHSQNREAEIRKEVLDKAYRFVIDYKEKYRGCGMADSMLALDEMLEAITPHHQNREAGMKMFMHVTNKEGSAMLYADPRSFSTVTNGTLEGWMVEVHKDFDNLTPRHQNREAKLLHDFAMFAHTNYYNGTDGSEYAYSQEVVYMVDSFLESFTPHHQELEANK